MPSGFDVRVVVLEGSITLMFGAMRDASMDQANSCSVPAGTMHEEHTQADGVRYVSGRREYPPAAA
jgi:hypothetical protein